MSEQLLSGLTVKPLLIRTSIIIKETSIIIQGHALTSVNMGQGSLIMEVKLYSMQGPIQRFPYYGGQTIQYARTYSRGSLIMEVKLYSMQGPIPEVPLLWRSNYMQGPIPEVPLLWRSNYTCSMQGPIPEVPLLWRSNYMQGPIPEVPLLWRSNYMQGPIPEVPLLWRSNYTCSMQGPIPEVPTITCPLWTVYNYSSYL